MRPKKVILCVDDNEQTLSVRTFLLETRGYRVINASTSQQALEILERTVPGTLDLLIADLLLPGMAGNALVRRAKQMLPKGAGTAAELLEKIRVLVARKRGPKKQVPAPQFQPQPVAAQQPAAAESAPIKRRIAS